MTHTQHGTSIWQGKIGLVLRRVAAQGAGSVPYLEHDDALVGVDGVGVGAGGGQRGAGDLAAVAVVDSDGAARQQSEATCTSQGLGANGQRILLQHRLARTHACNWSCTWMTG